MACMVLPSETARLVYGYLMKEKLDNIALQFLENSPYLTDCYHIVKSGYQFNTKFLYKELHELIQEYSTIQNLVDKKIGLLPKTSNLYKKIKLQCENLSEMIDLILFWKYTESKNEDVSLIHKSVEDLLPPNENKTDKSHELNVNSDNLSIQDSVCNDYISAHNSPQSGNGQAETEADVFNDNACSLDCKSDKNEFALKEMKCSSVGDNINPEGTKCGVILEASKRNQNIQEQNQDNVNEISNGNSNEINISMSTIDATSMDKANDMEVLFSNESDTSADRQIKIVRIENDLHENAGKSQLPNAFAQNMEGMESNMGIENSSVLYVAPDVGNLINHDNRNQIIVIPIDYYKSQNEIGNSQNQVQNLGGNLGNGVAATNEIIFEDVAVTPNLMPVTTASTFPCSNVEKKSFVDDNIVTEGTYLKNKEIIYELENKVKAQMFQQTPPLKEPESGPVSTIFVTQLIEKPDRRHRRILPRRDPVIQPNPIVVVQPLIEKKGVMRTRAIKCVAKKNNKTVAKNNMKVNETKAPAVLDMPSIRTPVHENNQNVVNGSKESGEKLQESQNTEKLNEEKENLEAGDNKVETPTVIVKRNSKRLSLSTPRRKSHIRALEFETPPKSGNGKKKSRTSPKVKVEDVKVKNKNVRNTLFKSPDLDTSFKIPTCLVPEKAPAVSNELNTAPGTTEAITEKITEAITVPTRRSPSKQTTDTWQNVTGMGCLLGDAKNLENKPKVKKSWDSDLRDFIAAAGTTTSDADNNDKKRARKPKKAQKDDKKCNKKPSTSPKKCKTPQVLPSPSKLSLTAKRNTYSISGNEEGSPVRSLFEELDFVTPFKDTDSVRPAEETPLTKLFRENVNGLDIDLNTINTPIFPPTPSIIITPDVEDSLSMAGTYYYSPLKDGTKEKTARVESVKSDVKKDEMTESDRKKGAKEAHEKVIGELVSKAKEIVGLRSADSEDHVIKKPPSGKVLSMVKIQMITQCEKKLYENIPINEESASDSVEQVTLIEKISEEAAKFDLKCELEEKRQRALRKLKSVKENFTPTVKKKVKRSPVKRKRSGDKSKSVKRVKRDSQNETSASEKNESSGQCIAEDVEIFHSTPYSDRTSEREDSSEKVDRSMLEEIRDEFPPFEDDGEFPELPIKTRKKLHYIHHFLKSEDILRYLENFSEKKPPRLKLKRSHRKFFQVFYKWLKHPHSREVNTSDRTKSLFKEYRTLFEKIKLGVSLRLSGCTQTGRDSDLSALTGVQIQLSDDDDFKQRDRGKKKEEDIEDGPVSILPLKKRKATVQPVEVNGPESNRVASDKTPSAENTSRTQTFLQDIDVDRFLSQIHGQENR